VKRKNEKKEKNKERTKKRRRTKKERERKEYTMLCDDTDRNKNIILRAAVKRLLQFPVTEIY